MRLRRLRVELFHCGFACVLLLALPASAVANLLTDGGFEFGSISVELPGAFGTWGGDPAGVAGAENGLSLGILVSAIENVENDLSPPELDGHDVDDVQLILAPVSAPAIAPFGLVVLTTLLLLTIASSVIRSRFIRKTG